jgi:cytochrome bd ubiquinol oxidase subunit II
LFAAFPTAYATVLSGFHTATVLLLCCLIFRAVSIEFRSKRPSKLWRGAWDFGFFASSAGAALVFGLIVGNVIQGVPLDEGGRYTGSLLAQLNGYALAVSALTLSMLALHGCLFLTLKTEGPLAERAQRAAPWLYGAFVLCYGGVTAWTLIALPHATATLEAYPLLWAVPILNLLAVLNVPRALHLERPGYAFFSSSCVIAALVFLFGVAQFPRLLTSRPDPDLSLTIYNAASSPGTLQLMSVIALIGMPLVLSYTVLVYWTFRGRVSLDEHSY